MVFLTKNAIQYEQHDVRIVFQDCCNAMKRVGLLMYACFKINFRLYNKLSLAENDWFLKFAEMYLRQIWVKVGTLAKDGT